MTTPLQYAAAEEMGASSGVKRVARLLLLCSVLLSASVACDDKPTSGSEMDAPDHDLDASDSLSDPDFTDVDTIDTDVSDTDFTQDGLDDDVLTDVRRDGLLILPVVPLPDDEAVVEPPDGCVQHHPFEVRLDFAMTRMELDATDESIWVWGPDHYLSGYERTGADDLQEVAFRSEQIGPPRIFPLGFDEDGARRFFHRDNLFTRDGDANHDYHPTWFTSPEQTAVWILTVTPDERAILYDSGSLDIWSCPLGCDQPEHVKPTATRCPLSDNCERLTTLPDPEHKRAVSTYLDGESLYWLGEQGVWKTALRESGESELVLQGGVRAFSTDGTWIAWVDLNGDAYLAQRNGDARFRLAAGLETPRIDNFGPTVWGHAEVDVLAIEDNWLIWWDGEEMRGFDLDRRVNLNAAWTTDLPSRPLGFELGACSSYTLLEQEEQGDSPFPWYILVRPRWQLLVTGG